jgi:hypothetical protein
LNKCEKFLKEDDEKNRQDPKYIELLQEYEEEQAKLI